MQTSANTDFLIAKSDIFQTVVKDHTRRLAPPSKILVDPYIILNIKFCSFRSLRSKGISRLSRYAAATFLIFFYFYNIFLIIAIILNVRFATSKNKY